MYIDDTAMLCNGLHLQLGGNQKMFCHFDFGADGRFYIVETDWSDGHGRCQLYKRRIT